MCARAQNTSEHQESARTSENSVKWKSNFRESPKGEVRRIPILRTPVNKGERMSGREILAATRVPCP
jgi:hypothetical protein